MNLDNKMRLIQQQAAAGDYRFSDHAEKEMKAESISEADMLEAIASGKILEDYPTHNRGACCLFGGTNRSGQPIHVVCTTSVSPMIFITVYLPVPPKWVSPTQRRSKI